MLDSSTEENIVTIAENIKNLMMDSGFDVPFFEMVLKRLDSFGYAAGSCDEWPVAFATQKVRDQILAECNLLEIPEELNTSVVDMVCGEFLFAKKQTGQLELGGIDLDSAVTSIKAGDTQVNFASSGSDEARFMQLLDYLLNHGRRNLLCYRRMRW